MPQPVLHTDRLLLVPLAERHLELQIGLDSDQEIHRYLAGTARTRSEVVEAHAARLLHGTVVDGLGCWMAFGTDGGSPGSTPPADEDAGEFVGLMILRLDAPSVAELGYRLDRRYWRRGLATEASWALLRHGFDTVGQSRVVARTMAVNTASRAVMSRLGMRHARTFFMQFDEPPPGSEQGEVEYEMTRQMWEAGPDPAGPPGLSSSHSAGSS